MYKESSDRGDKKSKQKCAVEISWKAEKQTGELC